MLSLNGKTWRNIAWNRIVVWYVECLEKDSQQVFLTLIHSPPLEGCLKGGVGD